MKTTKKKSVKKPTRTKQSYKTKDAEAVRNTAQSFLDQCSTAISTEKSVLLTLRDYCRKHRPQFIRFIVENSACTDPREIACRALIVTGWLELKTRGLDKPKTK